MIWRWECSLAKIYEDYLEWFRLRAKPGAVPWDKERLLGRPTVEEDLLEDQRRVFNRCYYHVPLPAGQSLSGQVELFSFSVLYLLEKSDAIGDENDALTHSVALEFRRE